MVWWCDVVCCGMSLAERSGAGGILEGPWWVVRTEMKLPLRIATAVRSAMRESCASMNGSHI